MSQATSALAFLFPGNAMVNSLLATSYISIIPNLLLYFVPPNINPSTLNVLVNFAVGKVYIKSILILFNTFLLGSLLGDVFLHLLPHAFNSHDHAHDGHDEKHHGNDENKSVLIGTGIFGGLFLFYAADKLMRAYYGKTGHDHSHSHDHKKNDDVPEKREEQVHASTYLNLLADFTHNLTDGIAMAASFYASPAIGATTAVAVFFHEIPHEVSDYAILIKSGFSKKSAMMAQFTTAIGAYIGTFIGIFIEEMASHHSHHHHHGIFGTSMTWGDLVIPATAGGFLYIATVGVIPELLEAKSTSKLQPLKELFAMVFGMILMAGIALNESHHH